MRSAAAGELADETRILYVSPLKALSNDVRVNLEIPLAGIAELARAEGTPLPEIRVAVRTGDTPMAERALMTRKAPHILVTTPESLFILLTAEKSRQMLRSVRTLIVDEIHAVAGSKRGSHLALSIARLEALAEAACAEDRVVGDGESDRRSGAVFERARAHHSSGPAARYGCGRRSAAR